jgi:uncharacterized protein YbjT (DUF2867 family)
MQANFYRMEQRAMEQRAMEQRETRTDAAARRTVLVTGATGYIGGRLVPRLLESGYAVRCLVRDPRKLAHRPWAGHPGVTVLTGDVSDATALGKAAAGCTAAYYLVHSMVAAGSSYAETDRLLANTFARAMSDTAVRRIVYLAGLGESEGDLSEHLSSRREVEAALSTGDVPVTVLRAAMIIGSGSASFEILRYLVERLPVMITPRWVSTPSQPIAVRNVLHYLVACLEAEETAGEILDIGGPDVLTYRELMQEMASVLGLPRRLIIPVPVLTPKLSALWIHLVTPVSASLARPLADGLRNPLLCRDDRARRLMPQQLLSAREAMEAAIVRVNSHEVETSWSDAGVMPGDPDWAGGTVFEDRRSMDVSAPPETVFREVSGIGGDHGYPAANFLWRLRGIMDRLVGGPGLRRGRRHPDRLAYGDAVDFWRVTALEPGRRLELRAEMKLSGVATLTFEVSPGDGGKGTTRLEQIARFKPRGLAGIAYWYAVLPLHGIVFRRMLRGLAEAAEFRTSSAS